MKRFRFPIKTAIALGVVLVLGLPVFSLLQPGYYRRYPALASRMDNWATSTHAKVTCASCHIEPQTGSFIVFAAEAIPAFYSQLLNGPLPDNMFASPGRSACQQCHTDYRVVSANGDLRMPHRAHVVALKIECAACHKDLVHTPNTLGFNRPKMAPCMTCHDGKQATAECVSCHTRKQVPDNHRAKDWLTVHAVAAKTIDCAKCHAWSPDYCRTCHLKRPASHAGNWKRLHAARAKAEGTKGCVICHEGGKSCKECHD